MPNGEAQKLIKKTFFKYKNLKYIDLSADFRLTNPQIYLKNYKINHKAKDLIKHALYSISELSRKKIHITWHAWCFHICLLFKASSRIFK